MCRSHGRSAQLSIVVERDVERGDVRGRDIHRDVRLDIPSLVGLSCHRAGDITLIRIEVAEKDAAVRPCLRLGKKQAPQAL
jgi:hypothetical protein